METSSEFILEIEDLSKSFISVQALEDVDLKVEKGEIHGLMGENGAGKSTLMKVLMGMLEKDKGTIKYLGEILGERDVSTTLEKGISMVHQEIFPVPELTVAQNIYLGKESTTGFFGWVDEKVIQENAEEQLRQLEVDIDVNLKMKQLSIAEKQMVEIAKALSNNARIIIMDEPTSSLSDTEVNTLFSILRKQKENDVTIIYISHRMEEIFEICDRISVLRDGKFIGTKKASELDHDSLIEMMVGRKLDTVFPDIDNNIGDKILSVVDLSSKDMFSDISFDVHRGEVLGFAGLMGAGRTEIAESIMGLRSLDEGDIYMNGAKIPITSPKDAIENGISYVSEDRKESGIIPDMSVKENITLSSIKQYKKWVIINDKEEVSDAHQKVNDLRIKTPNLMQKIKYLSGGNQQKVIIGKALLTSPDVLILDEPTRGIDVGAKFEIYELINQLVRQGKAVIVISSELPEILGLCHRILVFANGHITGELSSKEATQEKIMQHAMQFN